MYTKQEASIKRKNFWTIFGQYMRPLPNAAGEMINWLNYKTGIRHIYFRMDAGNKQASIAIELTHPDPVVQQQYFGQLLQLKNILEQITGEEWSWDPALTDEDGKTISRIGISLAGVNIFDTADWPAIISFFKPRLIALDAFWQEVKYAFE